MEARVAKLEAAVEHIQSDIGDIKATSGQSAIMHGLIFVSCSEGLLPLPSD